MTITLKMSTNGTNDLYERKVIIQKVISANKVTFGFKIPLDDNTNQSNSTGNEEIRD